MQIQMSSVEVINDIGATEDQLKQIRDAFRPCSEVINNLKKVGVKEVVIKVWYEEDR